MSGRAPERRTPSPYSAISGLVWPALPPPAGQAMLATLHQLEQSQWWSPGTIAEQQFRQIEKVVRYALDHVPWYRDNPLLNEFRSPKALSAQSFRRLPVTRKRSIQQNGQRFQSTALPPSHGEIRWTHTSGSSGQPLRAAGTDASLFMQHVLVLRTHLWYGLNLARPYAAIRTPAQDASFPDWGPPANAIFRTGSAHVLDAFHDGRTQLAWLRTIKPGTLLTYNTNLRMLLELSARSGVVPEGIEAVLGYADMSQPGIEGHVAEKWGARYFNTYSCAEIGTIAAQCPSCGHLHVQAERVHIEILREDDAPCEPGEIGRVVVTDLQNYAMPLIRYDLGDFASLGDACSCGRGLPVLKDIAGRTGHIASDPTGRRFFPHLSRSFWVTDAAIEQRQIVQTAVDCLEVRYVAARELSADEETNLAENLRQTMRFGYKVTFVRQNKIARTTAGKFFDFISLIDSPGATGA